MKINWFNLFRALINKGDYKWREINKQTALIFYNQDWFLIVATKEN